MYFDKGVLLVDRSLVTMHGLLVFFEFLYEAGTTVCEVTMHCKTAIVSKA